MVSGKMVKCFKTAILNNASERPLLRLSVKPALSLNGYSCNTLTGKASTNQVFQKILQNFLEHLTCQQKLLQEIILENTSTVSWYFTIFHIVKTLLEKFLFQIHPKSKQLEFHSYVPIISIIPCLSMQKIVCPSYLLCNFHKRGSLELWERFTEHQLGGECSHRILSFNQTDTNA